MDPPTVLAVKLRSFPAQIGLLLDAVGAAGVWLMVTLTVPVELAPQPGTVAIIEYVPEAAVVTLLIVGFCKAEEKIFGPVQE